jgi:autotransporter-associated beta strand protein
MKRVRIVAFTTLGLSIGLAPTFALAQSVAIPLNYAVNTGYNYGTPIANPTLILTINVGVSGGAAQPYAFDTGSSVFLTPNSVLAGGTSTVLAAGLSSVESYGSPAGATFGGNLYQIKASSLQFYATPGATSGGVSLSASGNYNVASYTSLNGTTLPSLPFGTAAVGVFGASGLGFFNNASGTSIGLGGVLGQTLLPNTTAGYVVSANGQSLAALNSMLGASIPGGPVTTAQQSIQTVPQSVTSCNPCVTVGLTPALLAQFLPLNTVSAPGNGTPFPNSNTPGIDKFVPFNFTRGPGSKPFTDSVSLDTGWPDFTLYHGGSGQVLTIAANAGGTQETFNIATTPGVPSPYKVSDTTGSSFVGLGFFVENSVLYDLTGQQVGYSPNFVTGANISTTQPLVIDSSSVPLGLAGVISGPGGVSVSAGGSATLSGSNTYTGPTSISGAGAYLALVGPGTISASSGVAVSSGGMFDISNSSSTATIRSLSGDSNGVVWLGNNSLALSNARGLFAGTIIGWGGLELMSGTETLSGTNTYFGATIVNGGTLQVLGSITGTSGVTVNSGGTLTGTGTIDPVTTTIMGGGTLAPGNGTPGSSITIAGNLAFQSGAIYLVQVSPATASFVKVTGMATLGGATVNAIFANGSSVSKQYAILAATGGVSGAFAPGVVNTNLPANFGTALSYDANHVYLDLLLNFASPGGLNGNQTAVGNALTHFFNATGSVPIVFGSLTPSALTQASGELATGSQQTTFDAMSQFMSLLTDPFMNRSGSAGVAPGATGYADEADASAYAARKSSDAYGLLTKAPYAKVYEPHWSVWAAGFGGSQSTAGNAATGSNNTTSNIYGTAVGADYLFSPHTIAGFALAGGGTSFSINGSGSGRSDLFQAGAYIRHTEGAAYISAALAYGWQDITTNRAVTIAGVDQLRAEFNANAWSGRIEGGYRFVAPWAGGIGVTPYAAGQFTTFDLPAYAESVLSGASTFALAYGAEDVTDARSELGIRADKSFALSTGILTLRTRVAWAHDYDPDRSVAATFEALPGASFVVNGAAQASDSALATASAEMTWMNGWSAGATFEGEFSAVTNSYAGKGVVRYTW